MIIFIQEKSVKIPELVITIHYDMSKSEMMGFCRYKSCIIIAWVGILLKGRIALPVKRMEHGMESYRNVIVSRNLR